MTIGHGFKWSLAAGAAVAAISAAQPAQAQQRSFDVPAQDMARAIPEFARQAGVQIVAPAGGLEGKKSQPVKGTMDVREGLRRLLQGSGLMVASDQNGVILLKFQGASGTGTQAATTASSSDEATTSAGADIVVTGTNIRGAQPSSPVVTITRKDMRLSGYNNLGEAIRALPQNFPGGQNPGIMPGGAPAGSNQNNTGSSGLDLRGLGQGATLTLLNGSRLPYDGFRQAIDVSVIPTAAIERVEILLDGASAIYGSDAVGGVANIILRHDYQGAEVSARYGLATDGGYKQQEYTALFGRN